MRHRTQLYLDPDQYRWLKRRAGSTRSMASVVRELIDAARVPRPDSSGDSLIRYLTEEPLVDSDAPSTVADLDRDLYR
jgi:hypothetical protein